MIGVFNSVAFPTFVSIMANWIPKKNRGLVVGLWATCNNFGNIVGIQLAALLYDVYDSWSWLLITIAIVVFVFGCLFFIFLIPEPSKVGIEIDIDPYIRSIVEEE